MDGPVALDLDGFRPRAVDKVRRLLTVLDADHPAVLAAAQADPVAQWKAHNLAKTL